MDLAGNSRGAALLAGGDEARASGFALREQSGSLVGQAFAGQNAYANDPSVIFFNPAGMSALDGTRVSGTASAIFPQNRFDDHGSSAFTGPIPVGLGNDEGGDAGEDALVPAVYAMTSYGDWRVGLGINSPFGLGTEYNHGWIGRFTAETSELQTLNINPVVSWQVNEWSAVGAGLQVQRVAAKLTNATLAPVGRGVMPGTVKLTADDWGVGFTAGALFKPMPGTQIGIGWRSSVSHTLSGDATGKLDASGATFLDTHAQADLTTPETVGLSVTQVIGDRLTVAGTVEWTNWSRFDELRVRFDGTSPADAVTQEQWNDTMFYSLGVDYRLLDHLTLRTGVAYDESPVRTKYRTARLPDQDRIWTAIGATYAFSDTVSVDAGYAHLFVRDAEIRENFAPIGGVGGNGTLRGKYHNSVDILTVQANFHI